MLVTKRLPVPQKDVGENGKKGACSHCGKGALVQTAGAVRRADTALHSFCAVLR